MPFEKGQGGRQKGVKNASTTKVEATAERLKCDPFEILCLIAKGDYEALGYMADPISLSDRKDAAKEACKYLYSQRRAIEATGDIETFSERQEAEIQELKEHYKRLREMK